MNKGEIASSKGTTQGDPMAMTMCALAIKPLIDKLRVLEPSVKQVWFADDATAAGRLASLYQWWEHIKTIGLYYGYYPNVGKTHLGSEARSHQ